MNKICMKNKIVFFLAVIVSFFTINVNAEELNTLYPVDSVISIQTKNFSYSEMKFNSGVKDRNGYPVISFGSITNNSKSTKPIPISIDILMFDSSQKNIGFITYCSEKDLDTDYSGAVIRQKESLPFNLSIVKKYFVKEKSYSDVAYFSVLDDNEYCKVGAYDKYEGLTYEEIKNGITKTEKSPADNINDLIFSLGAGVGFIGVFILIYGVILNALYKRMYAEKTVLAYLPFTNVYITIKLAFGSMIAKIYMILYFLSFGLVFLHLEILTAILSLVSGVAFILVIIKLITGKYDLLYFEPYVNNTNNNVGSNVYNNYSNNVNNNVSTDYTSDTSNSVLDLSYSNNTTNSSSNISSNITIGSSNSIGIGDINGNIDANNNYNQNNSFDINSNNGFNQNNFSSNNMNSMFNNKSNENNSNNMSDSNFANSLNNIFNNNSVNNDNFNTNKNTNNNSGSSSSLFNSSSNNNFIMNSNFTNNLTDDLYNDINKSDDDSDNNMDDGNSDLSNMFR